MPVVTLFFDLFLQLFFFFPWRQNTRGTKIKTHIESDFLKLAAPPLVLGSLTPYVHNDFMWRQIGELKMAQVYGAKRRQSII